MRIQGYDVVCDFEATRKYRDKYNEQCQGDECNNFRLNFKSHYPKDKIEMTISGTIIVLRNWNIADETYSNTGMEKPFFIFEILNIFVKDTKYEFYSSVKCGREIEFSYNGKNYFESRNSDTDWYIYCEETNISQHFISADELLKDAMLENLNINVLWNDIKIDYIL